MIEGYFDFIHHFTCHTRGAKGAYLVELKLPGTYRPKLSGLQSLEIQVHHTSKNLQVILCIVQE